MNPTFYEVMRQQGITRRSFLKFCSLTAASLGLGAEGAPAIAQAMQDQAAHAGALAPRQRVHVLLRVVHPLVASARQGRGAHA